MTEQPTGGFRFSLAALLTAVALVGGTFGVVGGFWSSRGANYALQLGLFLGCVTTASVGAYFCRPNARPALLGFAAFGWAYLAFVLHGGYGMVGGATIYVARSIAEQSQMGIALAVLAALATHLCYLLFGKRPS